MKRIILVVTILILTTSIYAQRHKKRGTTIKWLSVELKGGYGNSMLLNSDVSAENNVTVNGLSPAFNIGGTFGITFGDNFGVFVEGLSSSFTEEYDIKPEVGTPYQKTQEFKSFDIVMALRYTGDYGFYVEAGPVFNSLKSATETNSISGSFFPRDDNLNNFAEKYNSMMFGLGFAAFRGDRLTVNVGLRGTYALDGFVVNPSSYYVLNDGVYNGEETGAATNPLSIKVMLGVNYFFAFWGNASCGRGRIMFFQ